MHLIILASQSTVTIRGLGLCCCVPRYVSDICQLWLRLLSRSFSLGRVSLSVKGSKVVGVWKDTHTHTHRGNGKTDYSVAGEGVSKPAVSGPFGTFCHPVVTKRARVTKHAGSASNLSDKTCCSDKTCHHRASLFIVSLKRFL